MNARSWYAVNLGATEAPEVRALFTQVFGQPMSEALWQWRYGDGRGLATGTRDADGTLIAHYGSTVRTVLWDGQEHPALQMGDAMVVEQARGVLSRNGAFATAARSLLEQQLWSQPRFAVGFGFPHQRAGRLGEALGMYEMVGEIRSLEWQCQPRPAQDHSFIRRWATAPLDWTDPRTNTLLDSLWSDLRNDAQGFVLPQRDAQWWRHRFANHPDAPYRAWWVRSRFTRRILGAVVLRPGTTSWELMDWLGPTRQMGTLLLVARALAASAGASKMTGWFSGPLAQRIHALDGSPPDNDQLACQYCVNQRMATGSQATRTQPWWLTSGDTDFR